MTDLEAGRGRPRRVAAARAQVHITERVRDEVIRLDDGIQLALSALSAISESARVKSGESARVRSLGLECLPPGFYLGMRVRALRSDLSGMRPLRNWSRTTRTRALEIQSMLEVVIDLTATIDIAGELELSLDLVRAAQDGARTGLSCLTRLYNTLEAAETPSLFEGERGNSEASSSAMWIVQLVCRVLPAGSRDRYIEEFVGELHSIAEKGRCAQLVYAFGLAVGVWAL